METISVTITESSNVRCLDLYLINISTKVERCINITFRLALYCLSVTAEDLFYNKDNKDINILGTCYFILLDATLDAWQVDDTSVHLIFPALLNHNAH